MTTGLYKKGLVLAIICLFLGAGIIPSISGNNNFNAPPSIEWNKTYGGVDDDWGMSLQQTNDDGFIFCCGTKSYGAGDCDAWLVKTDSTGNKQWDRTYGGINFDWGSSVQQTSDGGFIIGGFTWSFGAGNTDGWLIKTDSTGNMLWDQTYGGINNDTPASVQQTNDGGYIICGETRSFGAGSYDVWLIKTDSTGNLLWNKTFGGNERDEGFSVKQTTDGGFIICGWTSSYGAGIHDVWLIKTDGNGNKLWDQTYGGSNNDWGTAVQQTTDGGFIITGVTTSFGAGSYNVWLVKTDSNGNKQWDQTYGGGSSEWGWSVQQTSDDGYIIGGFTESFEVGIRDMWLIKTDNNGNEFWNQTYGGTNWDEGRSVLQTTDGGFIIGGNTESFGTGGRDIWLIKVASDDSEIVVVIQGGFRVSAVIKNNGTATAYDVPWSIDLAGGLILAGSHTEGVIDELAPGATETIRQSTLYGIGRTTITVTAGDTTKQATGFILGPLVLNVQEI